MLSFKSFLYEAKAKDDSLERLISAAERRFPKTLGAIYRYGGSSGEEKVAGGRGFLYFFGKGKAFRMRTSSGKVVAVDIWTEYHPNKGPAFTADVADLDSDTLIGAIGELAKIIKNPSESKKNVTEAVMMEMAKRIGPDSFFGMMKAEYGESGSRDVTWAQIKAVADKNDVQIPAYIRDQKIGKGKWNSEPGAAAAEGEKKEPAPAKKEPILYIKVTAQDPDTKRFIPSGDSKAAQALYTQLQNSMSTPTPAEIKDPDTLYGHLAQLVNMAVKGSLRSLLIYGGPGTGKTFTIMKTIIDAGMTKGKDYVKLSGKATPVEIYKTLYMFRDNGLVVFDDLDSMWGNQDATNILKAALDTSPVREISWQSANTVNVSKMSPDDLEEFYHNLDTQIEQDPVKARYPSTFDFKGRVVFISNLKKEEFDSAIMSRSAKINMDLTPEQILIRMRGILPTLGGDDVALDKKEELLDHLLVMHKRKEITAVTMREFTKGLDILRSGVPNWKDLVQYA